MELEVLYGLTNVEYEEFKMAVKSEIPFNVSTRICKRKYALGTISILPTKKDKYTWTEEQFKIIKGFCLKYNLVGDPNYWNTTNEYLIYMKGVNFFYKNNLEPFRYINADSIDVNDHEFDDILLEDVILVQNKLIKSLKLVKIQLFI